MAGLKFISSILFCLVTCVAIAQKDSAIQLAQQQFIQGSFSNFYVDNLNNIYLLNTDNQIKKLDNKTDSVAVSNAQKRFGDIYSMDVSNALKLVVYYKDYTTIVVLDRFLKNVNTIDLRRYGILQAKAVALSYDNNYWVFDEVENRLLKMDDNGNVLLSTPDLRIVFGESFLPEKIIDYDGSVYLYNKQDGFKIFDYYGALKQSIPSFSWNNIQVIKNLITGFDSTGFHIYNTSLFNEKSYIIHPQLSNIIKQQKFANIFYVLQTDGLYQYKMN